MWERNKKSKSEIWCCATRIYTLNKIANELVGVNKRRENYEDKEQTPEEKITFCLTLKSQIQDESLFQYRMLLDQEAICEKQ